jgi:hypothetical protein
MAKMAGMARLGVKRQCLARQVAARQARHGRAAMRRVRARRGWARPWQAWPGQSRRGTSTQVLARRGEAGVATHVVARLRWSRPGPARQAGRGAHGVPRPGVSRRGASWLGMARQASFGSTAACRGRSERFVVRLVLALGASRCWASPGEAGVALLGDVRRVEPRPGMLVQGVSWRRQAGASWPVQARRTPRGLAGHGEAGKNGGRGAGMLPASFKQ